MGIRDILNSDYEPPEENIDDDWLLADPTARELMDFWQDAMREWRNAYGSQEGYNEFHTYWSLSGTSGYENRLSGASTAYDVFLGSQYRSVRDTFGYASEDALSNNSVTEIGNFGSRINNYQREAEESQWAEDWNQPSGD